MRLVCSTRSSAWSILISLFYFISLIPIFFFFFPSRNLNVPFSSFNLLLLLILLFYFSIYINYFLAREQIAQTRVKRESVEFLYCHCWCWVFLPVIIIIILLYFISVLCLCGGKIENDKLRCEYKEYNTLGNAFQCTYQVL